MKEILSIISICIFAVAGLFAQAPEKFNYQGVARGIGGAPIISSTIDLRVRLHKGSSSGPVIYEEIQNPLTNEFGLFNFEIGTGTGGTGFSSIDWGSDSYYLGIEMNISGFGYISVGTPAQLISVPYALYSKSSGTPGVTGPTGPVGSTGATGASGASGDRYATTTSSTIVVTAPGNQTITVGTGLQYTSGQTIIIANSSPAGTYFTGTVVSYNASTGVMVVYSDWNNTPGNYTLQTVNLNGAPGPAGATGATGVAGTTGPTGPTGVANISGTLNRIPKYTPNGTTLGNSQLFDNGTNVGVGFNAPASKLHVHSATYADFQLTTNATDSLSTDGLALYYNSAGAHLNNQENTNLTFYTNSSAGLRLTAAGNTEVNGLIKIAGGTPGAGKVLTAADATGIASWQTPSPSGWLLTGNTAGSSDFLGTNNSQPLVFKVNTVRAGYIHPTSTNTSFGYSALLNSAGLGNTAVGYYALSANGSGALNTAIGNSALKMNVSGGSNVAIGAGAMDENLSGSDNIAIGLASLGNSSQSGSKNISIGTHTMLYNTTGSNNIAVGYQSLNSNQTGFSNVAIGIKAMFKNVDGSNNTAVGDSAMISTRTVVSGEFTDIGARNTAVGSKSLYLNVTGINNAAFGVGAGYKSLGNNNTMLGVDADVNTFNATYINSTAVGYATSVTTSNQVRIGSGVSSIGGPQNWTNTSDGRFKINVTEDVPGIDFIKKLRPVTYNMDWKAHDKYISDKNLHSDEHYAALGTMVHSGFIAQEVEQAAKALDYNFSGVDAPKNEKDVYGLRYSDFVVPMVKAMQEQQVLIENLQAEIEALKSK